jgi:hypothetical protein
MPRLSLSVNCAAWFLAVPRLTNHRAMRLKGRPTIMWSPRPSCRGITYVLHTRDMTSLSIITTCKVNKARKLPQACCGGGISYLLLSSKLTKYRLADSFRTQKSHVSTPSCSLMIQEGETRNLSNENRSCPGLGPTQDGPICSSSIVPVDSNPHACPYPSILPSTYAAPSSTRSISRCIPLYDHLSDTLPAERLAALERLALEPGERVEDGSEQQENRRHDQASHHGQ